MSDPVDPPESIELNEEIRGLRDILQVAQVVVSSLELDAVLQNILQSAMTIMGMPAGTIALFSEENLDRKLTLHAHAGLSETFVSKKRWTAKEGGLTHRILQAGELFVVEDTDRAEFFNNPLAVDEGIRSLIAVPLQIQEKTVGILYVDDFVPRTFPPSRLRLLPILASFAAMSIDNAQLHEQQRLLACTDGLTGLYNHRQFQQMLREEVSRNDRYKKTLSLIMFDIDDFKKFNDRHGHPAGDRALTTVAAILRETLRECDTAFRYGGEEFIAILPETDIEEALVAAERARSAVEKKTTQRLAGVGRETITVSVGVAAYPRDTRDPCRLVQIVDQLLYRAKEKGKNKVYHLAEGI